jgi:hypothetical protein
LGVVEICGDGDDGLSDWFAQAHFGVGLQLGEDHRGDFLRAELLSLAFGFHFDSGVAVGGANDLIRDAFNLLLDLVELAAHEPLDRINGVAGVGDRLALGGFADQTFTGLAEGNDRRGGALAL